MTFLVCSHFLKQVVNTLEKVSHEINNCAIRLKKHLDHQDLTDGSLWEKELLCKWSSDSTSCACSLITVEVFYEALVALNLTSFGWRISHYETNK